MRSGLKPKEALAALMASFRLETMAQESIDIYVAKMSDITPVLLEAAVHRIAERSKFFPSIAEIRQTAAELAGLLPPGPEEALALIRQADVAEQVCRRDGTYAYTEHYWRWPTGLAPEVKELLLDTLEKVGDSCDGEDKPHFGWHQDFKAAYTRIANEVSVRALGDLSRAALPPASPKELTE